MNTFSAIHDAFLTAAARFHTTPALTALQHGAIGPDAYAAVLRQLFYQVRENPSLQALVATRFRGPQRALVKAFFGHALAEVGHDQLILDDLAALGHDPDAVRRGRPLPATIALIALPFFQIEHRNPVGYLGYLFFLEFLPTTFGHEYAAGLMRGGVPDGAMRFLADHRSLDHGHNRLMRRYVDELVVTRDDLRDVVDVLDGTADLYAAVFTAALAATAATQPA